MKLNIHNLKYEGPFKENRSLKGAYFETALIRNYLKYI